MGLPVIPTKTQPEAFTDLLESIALEETAIAHILNAEGEKIQASAVLMENGNMTPDEVIEFQKSITQIIQTLIKKEMILEFKLEATLDAKIKLETNTA
ncbi:MAG: hypothetical protein PHS24_02080 [Bacilli bacterium]|nr:hypothetical protein [Bacilli bacterium]